jgi:cell division septum initiation protein DivIVA
MGQDLDGRDDEINALLNIDGVDTAKLTEQITGRKGGDPPKTDPPKTDPPKIDPPKTDPPKKDVPDPEAIKSAMLNEMFGEHFKTVEDVKKADIPKALQERETLRQRNTELETQLKAKPKTQFVNEDIAKLNEFIRETGIKDVAVFNRLNATDVANMDNIDALVFQHIVENPTLAGKEPQVRKWIETRHNVDSKKVESGDLTQEELDINLIGIASEGAKAKAKLQELKGKIKMPEVPADEKSEGGKSRWTPEIETKQKAEWQKGYTKLYELFTAIEIPVKGGTAPIINFGIPEESRSAVLKNVTSYMVNNQLEVNEANVKAAINMARADLILGNLDQIIHAVSEHVRGLKEEEYLKLYHNPSPKKNTDTAGGGGAEVTDEAKLKRAFDAEMDR